MQPQLLLAGYRAGARLCAALPGPAREGLAVVGGTIAARVDEPRRATVARHLARAGVAPTRRAVRASFSSYARYWIESLRLPSLTTTEIDHAFDFCGYEHIERETAAGRGVIVVVPHLGGWEHAAQWLARVAGEQVTAVVEALEPPEVFEWFSDYRRALGIEVVALGPGAATASMRALRSGGLLCLLSDRDIGGGGVEVDFFGERTTLPAGAATLALRTGATLVACAVYFRDGRTCARVCRPLPVARASTLRHDVIRLTQDLAAVLEELIRADPTQWHLFQPNWPSDPGYANARIAP